MARAIVSSNADPASIFNGVNVNQLVGAETFYAQDFWGAGAIVANVEAGHVWNGHSTLQQVTDYIQDPSIISNPRQYDLHATAVGSVLVGRRDLTVSLGGGAYYTVPAPYSYAYSVSDSFGQVYNWSAFTGMAPSATLWSAALATQWEISGTDYSGSFQTDAQRLAYAYNAVMKPGGYRPGQKADVVNSSWGYTDSPGADDYTKIIDALAYAHRTTVVLAAGNHDGANEPVIGPASGYNHITVAALASDTSSPVYAAPASFSNAGPNDFYNPKTHTIVPGVRAAVDIAAPGDNLTLAYYGGLTGGNAGATVDLTNGSGYYFLYDAGGTSFASPVVAGGATLLADMSHTIYPANEASRDGRTIKAVLLNSADKTPGWSNAQSLREGVITTAQSLDFAVGAGRLNLDRAMQQYTAGTNDVPGLGGGHVQVIGWDYGRVTASAPNDYFIDGLIGLGKLSVTLSWFANRAFNESTLAAADVQMADLDLQVWRVVDGRFKQLIAESVSPYNAVEHLYFDLPAEGEYGLRVLWAGELYDMPGNTPDQEDYGLAWSATAVPEPTTLLLLGIVAALGALRASRGR